MDKPYDVKQYDLYDKTLLIQRLLFAISQNCREDLLNSEAVNLHKIIMKDAEQAADSLIDCLSTALEVIGYLPTIREVSNQRPTLWRQPVRVTPRKGENSKGE